MWLWMHELLTPVGCFVCTLSTILFLPEAKLAYALFSFPFPSCSPFLPLSSQTLDVNTSRTASSILFISPLPPFPLCVVILGNLFKSSGTLFVNLLTSIPWRAPPSSYFSHVFGIVQGCVIEVFIKVFVSLRQ